LVNCNCFAFYQLPITNYQRKEFFMNPRIITVLNQKGGSGKTTTAVNIASAWARLLVKGKRKEAAVLFIDIDPQASATAVLLGMEAAVGPRLVGVDTVYEVLLQRANAADAIQTIALEETADLPGAYMDVLPSHLELFKADSELAAVYQREMQLRRALQPVRNHYQAIIIDCPPSLGVLTLNALAASTEAVIPVDPGVFPLIGLNMLRDVISMIQQDNRALHISGVIPTMQDRTVLSRDTVDQLEAGFRGLVLPTVPRRVAVGEAHAEGNDIYVSSPGSEAAEAYLQITQELMNHG
jgi:chromosome partitioning protein